MKKIIVITAIILSGCAAPEETKRTLDDAGYDKIKTDGWAPFRCGEDDFWSTHFEADNIRGKRVKGVVCCGMFLKECTIRH